MHKKCIFSHAHRLAEAFVRYFKNQLNFLNLFIFIFFPILVQMCHKIFAIAIDYVLNAKHFVLKSHI
jgi:hypothetical protein